MKIKNIVLKLFLCILTVFLAAGVSDALTAVSKFPVLLFSKPERGGKAEEIGYIDGETEILEVKYVNGERWYKAEVNGKVGWLFSGTVSVARGEGDPEPDMDAAVELQDEFLELYKKSGYDTDEGWLRRPDVLSEAETEAEKPAKFEIYTYASEDALLQLFSSEQYEAPVPVCLIVSSASAADKFLGFPAVGMTEPKLKEKLGEPGTYEDNYISYGVSTNSGFTFYLKGGLVYKAVYYFDPPESMGGFPERAYELRRLLNAQGEDWPIYFNFKEINAKLYYMPSWKASSIGTVDYYYPVFRKESDALSVADRGEEYPWYLVQAVNGEEIDCCWLYGGLIDKVLYYDVFGDDTADFFNFFMSRMLRYFTGSPEVLEKFFGEPYKKGNRKGEWEWKWQGFSVAARKEDDELVDVDVFEVTGAQVDIGGFRIGDPVSALDELVRALEKRGYTFEDGGTALKEGMNVISFDEGASKMTIVIKDGKLKSFEYKIYPVG